MLFNYHAHSLNFPEQSIYVNKNIDNLSVLISTCGKEEVYGVIEIIPEQLKEFYSWMEEWKAKYNLRIPEENIGQASKKALMNENKDDFSELESNCEVKIAKIKERLSHLNGKNEYNKSFLSGHDYEELVKLTVELVCNNSFHTPHNTFDLDGISVRSITYTYYLIMRDNEPQHKVNDKYIDFLHEVFHNKFANTEKETTKKKLSSRPKRYPF
ncbi:MAG: hypothetical protein KKC86_09420 [Bacteroidetes bacterium]|nr:hypothetical protein [Bacteroidota bacterium]